MKPFDLKSAKAGAPIVTRDGTPAKYIAHVPEARRSSQVLCLVRDTVFAYAPNGDYDSLRGESMLDLYMASTKRTVWVNLYASNSPRGVASYYDNQVAADNYANSERLGGKAWPLEITE